MLLAEGETSHKNSTFSLEWSASWFLSEMRMTNCDSKSDVLNLLYNYQCMKHTHDFDKLESHYVAQNMMAWPQAGSCLNLYKHEAPFHLLGIQRYGLPCSLSLFILELRPYLMREAWAFSAWKFSLEQCLLQFHLQTLKYYWLGVKVWSLKVVLLS